MRGRTVFLVAILLAAGCGDDVEPVRGSLEVRGVIDDGAYVRSWDPQQLGAVVAPEPFLTAADFTGWRTERAEAGEVRVIGVLTDAAARRFADETEARAGGYVAVLVDGRVTARVRVIERVTHGQLAIFHGPPEIAAEVQRALR